MNRQAAARQPLAPRGLRARRTFWGVTGKPSLGSNAFSRWREMKAAVRHVIGAAVSEKMKKVMRVEKEEGLPDLHHHGMDRPRSRIITSRPNCGLRASLVEDVDGNTIRALQTLGKRSDLARRSARCWTPSRDMDKPERFGDDQQEHMLTAMSRLTYHLRRQKTESEGILRQVGQRHSKGPTTQDCASA